MVRQAHRQLNDPRTHVASLPSIPPACATSMNAGTSAVMCASIRQKQYIDRK